MGKEECLWKSIANGRVQITGNLMKHERVIQQLERDAWMEKDVGEDHDCDVWFRF